MWGFFKHIDIPELSCPTVTQEPTGAFLMLTLGPYYSHLWFVSLHLKISSKICYCFQNEY